MKPATQLARLLRPGPIEPEIGVPSPEDMDLWVEEQIAQRGLRRPEPFDETADEDPHAFLWWLMRMAAHTYRRLVEPLPPVDAELIDTFRGLLERRPCEEAAHAQLHIDPESSLRRAQLIAARLAQTPGRVLAVGDDDAVTLALVLLGVRDLCAIDIDNRLLHYLRETCSTQGADLDTERIDVYEDAVPERLVGACAVVVTDPPRSYDDCVAFLGFGGQCVSPRGALLWADHPDWNFEHAAVMAALPELGLQRTHVAELVHAYPLSATWLPDPESKARQLGVDPEWLRQLLARTRAYTHLFVLEHPL